MDQSIRISVIIPTYNSQSIIAKCLEALENQDMDRRLYEIIVVDDGSTDSTREYITQKFPGVRLIPIIHGGPSVARNAGAQAARGEIIAFTDSDCVAAPDWLETLAAPFVNQRVVGVKGVYRTHQRELIARFVQLEYQYKYERMAQLPRVDFIDTYSAAYRREVFLQNGGFNTSFTVPSVEDQELSFRLDQKGYWLMFAKNAAVYHTHDRDIQDYWKRKFGIGYWKAFMLRWLPQKTFNDSHTSPSQRWQIGFLALGLGFLVLGIFLPWALWAAAACALVFIVSGVLFMLYTLKRDFTIGLLSPFFLVLRAIALGTGLLMGFLSPPRGQKPQTPSLRMGAFFLKRLVDILGSLVGLVISTPVVLFSALAIRLDSPGPAFFTQIRAGEDGKPFRMIKLRTMVADAEERISEVLALNPLQGPAYKIPNDPRVTRVGKYLRRWSIDELPQFLNVLKGEMSLVGPRPEEMWVVEMYSDEQRKRLAFKPGLTGPMQVNGRGELNFDERLDLELEYMQNYSLWKDFKILLHSMWVILTGKGAF